MPYVRMRVCHLVQFTHMLWRLWLALSVIWFGGVAALVHWTEITSQSAEAAFAFAIAPLVIGLILRRALRFVVAGQ